MYAYPSGGGAYIVSKDNLGELPSLIAGASLLTDYILTVAVSVAAGVLAMQSAFDFDSSLRVPLCLGIIVLITIANLRGLRESGALFAPPTYLYIVMLGVLIVVGLYRVFFRDLGPIPLSDLSEEARELAAGTATLSLFMLLRAFSSGAVALSGVEAVSNGVQTFRKPESRNASTTLAMMGLVLGAGFLGISVLASHLMPFRGEHDPTGIALMAEYVFGGKNVLFWVIQFATFGILVLAANTAYAGFPALSSIIARDGYLPRQMANRGDKLVFSNGIIFLAARRRRADHRLRRQRHGADPAVRLRRVHRVHAEPGRHGRAPLPDPRAELAYSVPRSTVSARRLTGIVAIVVVVSKFSKGAWIPAVLIPLMVVVFKAIHGHYVSVRAAVRVDPGYKPGRHTHTVVILVGTVHRGVLDAIQYARELAPDRLFAVSVVTGPGGAGGVVPGVGAVRHPDPGAHDPVSVPRPHRSRVARISTRSTPTVPTTSSR